MIKITKLTSLDTIKDIVKHCWDVDSVASLDKWYTSEHSPIYSQIFLIYAEMPQSVMSQLRTHEKNGCQFYSSSGRPDTGNESDNSRAAIRKVVILCNARHIVSMAHKRMCDKAEKPTRDFMYQLAEEMEKVDPELVNHMMPKCQYLKGGCNEFKSCTE